MEGPSLFLAQEQLQDFKGKKVISVLGNSKVGKERLVGKEIKDIFSWGKHLVFQFDTFAIRVHFLLFGTFEADINGVTVTGDYKRSYETRLTIKFENGEIRLYNCSIKMVEENNLKEHYDFSVDIMSDSWDSKKAFENIIKHPDEQIADVLLDQEIFSGVGNMIKNEVLSITKVNPQTKVNAINHETLKQIIGVTRDFSTQFYKWRKDFVLTKNLKIHRRSICPFCGQKVVREKTGKKYRISYYCRFCQPIIK